METYTISFDCDGGGTAAGLLRRLSAGSDRVAEQGRRFVIDDRMTVEPDPDETEALHVRGTTNSGLYLLLEAYFDGLGGGSGGAIVTPLGGDTFRAVFLTTDENTDFGTHSLGINVHARELLGAEATFLAAWPGLIEGALNEDEEFPEDETVVETGLAAGAMLIADLVGSPDAEHDEISFLLFGVTPKAVMEQLLRVARYTVSDDEYLSAELPEIDESIVAVSFDTNEGATVELRLPLPQSEIAEATRRLAVANAGSLEAGLAYVGEIDPEDGDMFLVQPVARDGQLGEPRRVTLVFDL